VDVVLIRPVGEGHVVKARFELGEAVEQPGNSPRPGGHGSPHRVAGYPFHDLERPVDHLAGWEDGAAIAFFQHPGTTAEPPLKPYANAAWHGC
jgi:hypothetical protein